MLTPRVTFKFSVTDFYLFSYSSFEQCAQWWLSRFCLFSFCFLFFLSFSPPDNVEWLKLQHMKDFPFDKQMLFWLKVLFMQTRGDALSSSRFHTLGPAQKWSKMLICTSVVCRGRRVSRIWRTCFPTMDGSSTPECWWTRPLVTVI